MAHLIYQLIEHNLWYQHVYPHLTYLHIEWLLSEFFQNLPFSHIIHDFPLLFFKLCHVLGLKASTQHLGRTQHIAHGLRKDNTQVVDVSSVFSKMSLPQIHDSNLLEILIHTLFKRIKHELYVSTLGWGFVENLRVSVVVFIEEKSQWGVFYDKAPLGFAKDGRPIKGVLENGSFEGLVLRGHFLEFPLFPLFEDLVHLEVLLTLNFLHENLRCVWLLPQVVSDQQAELLNKSELSREGLDGGRSWGSSCG